MNKRNLLIILGLLFLAQIYVPAGMIISRESTIKNGKAFRFETAPIDPNDPFRGKYVSLRLEPMRITTDSTSNWNHGDEVYAVFDEDSLGFAQLQSVSKEAPTHEFYLQTKVIGVFSNALNVEIPFNRFYMEESKARPAERVFWDARRHTARSTYAIIHIKDGQGVLSEVMIDGKPLAEAAEEYRDRPQK